MLKTAAYCRYRHIHWRLTPLPSELPRMSAHNPYIARKPSPWATFLLLTVWVYFRSNFLVGLLTTHVLCNRVLNGRSGSFKVVDFVINRKGVCNVLLIISSNLAPILHHVWDTATYWLKIASFPTPLSLTSTLGVNHFEFLDELFISKIRVLELSVGEDLLIIAYVILTQYQRVRRTDGRTDGRTDRQLDRSLIYRALHS